MLLSADCRSRASPRSEEADESAGPGTCSGTLFVHPIGCKLSEKLGTKVWDAAATSVELGVRVLVTMAAKLLYKLLNLCLGREAKAMNNVLAPSLLPPALPT
jgi:hypothetical protein